jgi:hypothetical protein
MANKSYDPNVERDLLTHVGSAISRWSGMEDMLVRICVRLLDAEKEKTGVVMYSVFNFNTRLDIISELFDLSPNFKSLTDGWGGIAKRLRALNLTRNRLAHHTILERPGDEFAREPALRPAMFDVRTKSKKYKPLTLDEIEGHDRPNRRMRDISAFSS